MDAKVKEEILKYLVQGADMFCNALALALFHYQNEICDENENKQKGGDQVE